MDQQVYITGSGIICAIGQNTDEVRESLKMERTGIARLQFIETRHRDVLSVGEVKSDNETLQSRLELPTSLPLTRTALLGLTAAREAMFEAGITGSDPFRTGLISATSVGGMDIVENHFQSFIDQEARPEHLNYIHHLDCSASTEQIAQYLGIRSFLSTISTACSSSANAIMYGARLIRHNLLDRVLVGGTDALSRFTINGFHCLQILDPEPCKPFDRDRAGLNLGEGAGYLVLESEKALGKRQPIARLSGYSNVNDAYHQTASSPTGEGALDAMSIALAKSGLRTADIGYINVHGTGTEINDLSEGLALQRLFAGNPPPFSSTKSYTGHALAAAGGIEAVISLLSLQSQQIPLHLNWRTGMPELTIQPHVHPKKEAEFHHVMSNSFGFGGNTSTLILSTV